MKQLIDVVPYDVRWPERFLTVRARIKEVLGDVAERIDHIGSTAVPGLAAKPVIDVQISVDGLEPDDRYREPLEELGFEFRSDAEKQHRFFSGTDPTGFDVHIHVCETGSQWERRHLAFRDFLRRRPELASRYGNVKMDAAAAYREDRAGYYARKAPLVITIERDALRWAERISGGRR